ncbi:MAG: hypothetical protein K0S86_10 [Geminicoccaceae bacterium]|jgi:hypothetical protein|nr:hypothetical protein [Geminicoccaceae bacterium]
MRIHRFSRGAAVAIVLLAAAPYAAGAQSSALPPELQSVRALLDKYADPIVAVHDGFLSTVACVEYLKGGTEGSMQYAPGGMGVHFINMGNVGPTLDPSKPQVLIYEPVGDKLRLVAAEWFMPAQLAGAARPSIFGKELQGPMEGHKPLMPAEVHHYDLHVWLWKTNPEGVYSPTNPAVKCPKAAYSFAEDAPKMIHKHP